MHDREFRHFWRPYDTFRYFSRLFETFRSQKVHEFDEVLHGKDEVVHGKDEVIHGQDEYSMLSVKYMRNARNIPKNNFETCRTVRKFSHGQIF